MIEIKRPDYYEFLQISPKADPETIDRVYRFLASRFHPDNPVTGDPEKFFQLKRAYDILSDPKRRADYDSNYQRAIPDRTPLSTTIDFMDDLEGELNRRVAILALLYYRRRNSPYAPEIGLTEIERHMGFPRDYLDFTTWYLVKKGYVTRADNSDFTLTAEGVDFVETKRAHIPQLNKMLTVGAGGASHQEEPKTPLRIEAGTEITPLDALAARLDMISSRMVVMPDMTILHDRRKRRRDRRANSIDRRIGGSDRRVME
jgi:curved DNA-binding protein CbpA